MKLFSPLRILLAAMAYLAMLAPSWALELVMVERAGCAWCERWDREVAPIYEKSDEGRRAPLRRESLDKGQPKLQLTEPVRYTPTFLLVDGDREVGRIVGYLDNAMFWGLLGALLQKHDGKS